MSVGPPSGPDVRPGIDTTVPHSARIWNYWLGGTDNFPVDRGAGDEYLHADLRDPDHIVSEAGRTLDFGRPVALILSGVLGHVVDTGEARALVQRLLAALPTGGYLSLNDGTAVFSDRIGEAQEGYGESGAVPYTLRTPAEIAGFFEGLDVVEPGVVACPRWRPDPGGEDAPGVDAFGGVGRKP